MLPKQKYYKILSALFVAIILVNLLVSFYLNNWSNILWFCSFTAALFALGLYTNNNFLLSTSVTAAFFFQTLWVIEMTSYLLFGKLILGTATYLLEIAPIRFFITFYHLLLLIIPIWVIFEKGKIHRLSWLGASLLFFIASVSVLVLATESGVNCVNQNCNLGVFNGLSDYLSTNFSFIPFFVINWIVLSLIVFIPTHFLFSFILRFMKTKIR